MAISINTLLTKLAADYYISSGSSEANKIESSLVNLKSKLKNYFDKDLTEVFEFGSYKRDTILPRKYDNNSDVDLMIVFNHADIKVNPSTYRKYLQDFADLTYPNSASFKSRPTVVLELNHIITVLMFIYNVL